MRRSATTQQGRQAGQIETRTCTHPRQPQPLPPLTPSELGTQSRRFPHRRWANNAIAPAYRPAVISWIGMAAASPVMTVSPLVRRHGQVNKLDFTPPSWGRLRPGDRFNARGLLTIAHGAAPSSSTQGAQEEGAQPPSHHFCWSSGFFRHERMSCRWQTRWSQLALLHELLRKLAQSARQGTARHRGRVSSPYRLDIWAPAHQRTGGRLLEPARKSRRSASAASNYSRDSRPIIRAPPRRMLWTYWRCRCDSGAIKSR